MPRRIARYIMTRSERIDQFGGFPTLHWPAPYGCIARRAGLGHRQRPLNLAIAALRAEILLAAAGAQRLGAKRLAGTLRSRYPIQRPAARNEGRLAGPD